MKRSPRRYNTEENEIKQERAMCLLILIVFGFIFLVTQIAMHCF